MTELQISPGRVATSASALLGRSVLGPDGKVCGRVNELAVDVSGNVPAVQTHVAALLLRGGSVRKGKKYLLLDYDLLDQQIIDVDGRKVVRVNDVNLAWEQGADAGDTAGLRIEEVEGGNRRAMRGFFKGRPVG